MLAVALPPMVAVVFALPRVLGGDRQTVQRPGGHGAVASPAVAVSDGFPEAGDSLPSPPPPP
ncbi:MAG: hypothetical protein ACYCX8_06665, partial [Acidimicrobiales bacterium]